MKYLIQGLLFVILLSYTLSLSLHSTRLFKERSLLQTRMKLGTLTHYLSQHPQIDIDIPSIRNQTHIYAYYSAEKSLITLTHISSPLDGKSPLIAEGQYEKTRFTTGWDTYNSKTYATANPVIQCYASGLIEGLLSYEEIYDYRNNFEFFFENDKEITLLKDFFTQVDENIKAKLNFKEETHNIEDNNIKVLSYLACLHSQINGLHHGYSLIAPDNKKLDLSDLYFLNSEGYYSYLLSYLSMSKMTITNKEDFNSDENLFKFYNTNNIEEIWKRLIRKSHCSAIVKMVTKNGERDLFVGHNTWTGYNELLRTLKHVNYAFEGNNQVIGMSPFEMKYSSYPGILFSGDEYYQIDKLVITQTSLSVINKFEYKDALKNKDDYIPEYMRIMIINFLSKTGKEWVNNYETLFKGNHIYNAQWMVIDYTNLNKDSELLFIVEELPRSVKSIDYTKELIDNSYYGSFNLPFFKRDHHGIAGLNLFRNVNFYDKKYNPRQYLVDQLQNSIKTIEDFKDVLMYNGYKKTEQNKIIDDPSIQDPTNGIASRTINGNDGAIDFKIVNKDLVEQKKIWVYSGPVYDNNPNFEPYDISKVPQSMKKYSKGMPTLWNFKPFIYQ